MTASGRNVRRWDIVNLFRQDTAEWDAYEAMLERLEAIHSNVGEFQPILYDGATANRLAAIIHGIGDRRATPATSNRRRIAAGHRNKA